MLNENNNIKFVELQANVGLGLDDVVVTYNDGKVLCIQVKHTRADDTAIFAVFKQNPFILSILKSFLL